MTDARVGVRHVAMDEVDDLLAAGWRLLDVREPWEVAVGAAPDVVAVPLGHLPADVDRLAGDDWIVVCRVGARSAQACVLLGMRGIGAVNLLGGMHAWQDDGRTVVTAEGAAGAVA